MRILLVEDDCRLSQVVAKALRQFGWSVDVVASCAETYAALRITQYQAMVLDLTLPDGDGLNVVRSLRTVGDSLPILILTAKRRVSERVAGLNAGADDYMVKPFATIELHARLSALTRRTARQVDPVIRFGAMEFDPSSRIALHNGKPLPLTLRAAMVLRVLMQANGNYVSRTMIEKEIISFDQGPESRAVDIYVKRLRNCLDELTPKITIENQRGIGYRIVCEDNR